jgi:uracil-DNA glycosylase
MTSSTPARRLTVVQDALSRHVRQLASCAACPEMIGPVVAPPPVVSPVYLVGQAPGPHEGELGRPFAWTAGKTLFRWFGTIGVDEAKFREKVYMAAVCRCFPGKSSGGGDRVPSAVEIDACGKWMQREIGLLQPRLVIPVGKLAIEQIVGKSALVDVIGGQFEKTVHGHRCDVIPLPHPSGASTWFKMEPGKTLLTKALTRIAAHDSWKGVLRS